MYLKIILPIALLALSSLGAWALIEHKQTEPSKSVARTPPAVTVQTAQPVTLPMNVKSQGRVTPRTEINLVSEIPGKVLKIHPALSNDGFFQQGEVLVTLDSRDYDYALSQAKANVAAAELELQRGQEEVAQAHKEWETLGTGRATDFVLRKPHLAERRAKLAAAQAELQQAKLNRSRGELRAPFSGRVQGRKVDVGQFVTVGETLAVLYPSDVIEVRLPIGAEQLRFLELPINYPDARHRRIGPKVDLSAELGGKTAHWQGRIVRTEGAVDEKTGVFYGVAEVREPFAYHPGQPSLALGLYVSAEITGIARDNLVALPSSALKAGFQVFVVDRDERLRLRNVEVLRSDRDTVVIAGGIQAGERVLVAGLDLPIEGMKVTVKP